MNPGFTTPPDRTIDWPGAPPLLKSGYVWKWDKDGQEVISIARHGGSYGGDNGLFEVWVYGQMEDPEGYLSLDEANELIEARLKEEK